MFRYGQEIVVLSGPFKGYRGIVDSEDDGECKVVMYGPISMVLTFSVSEIEDSRESLQG